MKRLSKMAVGFCMMLSMILSLAATTHAGPPSSGDLDKAINSGDFAGYSTSLTKWLNEKVSADPNSISKATVNSLLEDADFAKALAQRQFIGKVGAAKLASFAKEDKSNSEFLAWVLGNTVAMEHCLEGASPVEINHRRDNSWGVPGRTLAIWKSIYDADPKSKQGVNLKLAIATGLSPPGTGNRGAGQAKTPATPLARYKHFKAAHKNNELARGFAERSVWDYRQSVSSNASDEDLAWARQMVNTWRPDLRINEQVVLTTSDVWRRNSPISHNGTYKNVLDGGGQCGPRSSWAVFINQAFGIPSIGVGQPRHACAAYKANDPFADPQIGHAWKVVYGRGWGASRPGYGFFEGSMVRSDLPSFMRVERMRWLASALTSHPQSAAVKAMMREITEIARKRAVALPTMNTAVFTLKPDATEKLDSFASPVDDGENYAAQVRGYVTPPESGNYVFYIAGDDDTDLLLSTDETPEKKVHIVHKHGWVAPMNFRESRSQASKPIRLESGKRYYIEALHKQNLGGAHLAVAWSGPVSSEPVVIPGTALAPYKSSGKSGITREKWFDLQAAEQKVRGAVYRPGVAVEPPIKVAPGVIHIEAETFVKQYSVQVFDCYTGGQQINFRKSNNGAFAEYVVDVPKAGVYELTLRTAAANRNQVFKVTAGAKENAPLTLAVPNSHGLWTTTAPLEITLAKGTQTLKLLTLHQRAVGVRWLQLKAK